jgi:hypothetical protein
MASSRREKRDVSIPTGREEVVREIEERRHAAIAGLKRNTKGPWVRVALPSNREAVMRLPIERRELFEAHLRAIIAKASDSSAEPPDPISTMDGAGESPVSKLLGRACGTCRGMCCRMAGEKHAYLASDSIQVYRTRNPGASTDEIVATYMSRIPEETYEGSCVFHGRDGCVLPRPLRSEMCNWYLCDSLIELSRSVALEDRATVYAVAMRGREVDRLAVFDADGVLYEEKVVPD